MQKDYYKQADHFFAGAVKLEIRQHIHEDLVIVVLLWYLLQ